MHRSVCSGLPGYTSNRRIRMYGLVHHAGWEQLPSPDIVDDSGSWQFGACTINMPGPIPNGGSASLFVGASWGAEGIYTTVDGLVPGNSYSFGFYWASIASYNCTGTEYTTDPSELISDDWERSL